MTASTTALSFGDRGKSRVDIVPREPKTNGEAKPDIAPGALEREKLEAFIAETRNEPSWRKSSDMDADYYDSNQLRPDTLGEMEERGIPPVIVNLVQPIVNTVLGMEAKTRSDWEVTADDKPSEPVAQMMNEKMNEAERESSADRAISEAYAGQIKAGLGWVEVGDQTDPFLFPYRVQSVHRREIWWDFRARNMDLTDARYLIRRQWYDVDVLTAMLPQWEKLFDQTVNSWAGFSAFGVVGDNIEMARSYEEERASTLEQYEWLDTGRKRCQIYEVWYRRWVRGHVLRLANNKVIEVDRKNPRHMEVIASGALTPIPATFPVMRVSMWLGPHRLSDRVSPLPHRRFPYVPFWGYREDLTSAPYGIIRAMRSPQDEVNARRSKLLSLITGRRVIMDSDAVDKTYNNVEDVADEVGRADAVVVLNPDRKNRDANAFRVETNGDLAVGQMKTLEQNKGEMHEVSGIFPPAIGDPGQGLSGVAIDNLVDQSTTTLAEINDNYRFGRRSVGELLMAHVRRDLVHPHEQVVGKGKNAKSVYFNRSVWSEEVGAEIIENSVANASIRMTLSDIPSTATYRRQQFAALAELTKGLPPEIQALVTDFVIEASDVKDRSKIAERIRKALGIPDPDADDTDPNGVNAQVQALQAQHQEVVAQLMEKLQPALAEVDRLKTQMAAKEGEIQLGMAKEQTRQMEVQADQQLKAADLATTREIELEKLDLERERLATETNLRTAEINKPEPVAPAEPVDNGEADAKLAALGDDIRDMVKALADEIASHSKEVAELKKGVETKGKDDAKQPEPVKADDIAAALTKALAPVLQQTQAAQPKAEEKKPGGKKTIKVVRDERGSMQGIEVGEAASTGRKFKVLRDEKGVMQGVEEG